MTIKLVKIRATITVGNILTVSTPYIQSFNVQKSRGQSDTFSATLKVDASKFSAMNTGGVVTISAGSNGVKKIYTGILKKLTLSPCWDDPGYVLLNISGTDILSELEGKKYSRRCRATKSTWVSITSVTREGLRDGKFDKEFQVLASDGGSELKKSAVIDNMQTVKANKPSNSPGEMPIRINVSLVSSPEVPLVSSPEVGELV